MSTQWTISSDADRLKLDPARHGEISFTVANAGDAPERAMFDVVTDPATQAWYTVAEPQRLIPGGGSVRYTVSTAIPAEAPAGRYQVQGRVYSLDSAPEETSVLSNRVVVEIAGATPLPKRRWPPWLLIGAGVAVVALIVTVLVLVLRPHGTKQADLPATVVVPDITALPEAQALDKLVQTGLQPRVKHRQSSTAAPATQSYQPGLAVARGTVVEVVFAVQLAAPVIGAPPGPYSTLKAVPGDPIAARYGMVASTLTVTWTQAEPYVASWRVTVQQNACATVVNNGALSTATYLNPDLSVVVTARTFTTVRYYTPVFTYTPHSCGDEYVRVAAIDDFGNIGQFSPARQYGLATK
jgi:hypothetical protein